MTMLFVAEDRCMCVSMCVSRPRVNLCVCLSVCV